MNLAPRGQDKASGKHPFEQSPPASARHRNLLLEMMEKHLKMLAPYIAVGIFWCVWPDAWLAILGYHAQILLWNWPVLRRMRLPQKRKDLFLALPTVLAGPMLYVLLPVIAKTEL
jgi:hypothetical protein